MLFRSDFDKNEYGPEHYTKGSSEYVWWKCPTCGNSYKAKIANKTILKRGCPFCSNNKVLQGFNDLTTTNPELSKEWDYEKNGDLTPDKVTYGSNKKVWWICPKGHSYQATINHRSGGTNCPICNSGRQTSFAEQAIFYYMHQLFPDAINRYKEIFSNGMELDIYIPSMHIAIEYDGSFWHDNNRKNREKIKFDICQKHHIRLIRIKEKSEDINNEFANNVFLFGEDLNISKLNEKIIQLFAELNIYFSGFCETSYKLRYINLDINLKKDEFKIREYMKGDVSNNFATLYPNLAKEWDYDKNGTLLPTQYKPMSDANVWWKCTECGYERRTTIGKRVQGTGCPRCYEAHRSENMYNNTPVLQLSMNGEFIKEWRSISFAARSLKLSSGNIGSVLKGTRRSCGGFKWQYKKSK